MSIATGKRQRWHGIRQFSGNRSGSITVLVAMVFPVLLVFLGLALDFGHVYHFKRRMQAATDAGAMAGAVELYRRNASLVNT